MRWRRLVRRRPAEADSPPRLLSVEGALPPSPRVALWVHWEADGQVSDADVAQLQHLRDLGHAVVAVGNRDDGGSEAFRASLDGVADVVLQRQNLGYDFAGFRDGLLWVREHLREDTTLLLLNNSCYGPFGSLEPLLTRASAATADVWAATSSEELEPHLQSYLLLAHPAALSSEGFWAHWAGVRPPVEKMDVVRACEIPLGARLRAAGLRTAALVPYEDLADRAASDLGRLGPDVAAPEYARVVQALERGAPLNPTHHLWRWLGPAGVPLVKKDLLRVNPPGLPDVARWRDHLPEAPVAGLVAADLARSRP